MSSGSGPGTSQAVPVGILNGGNLADLGGNQGQTAFRKAGDIHANVQRLVRAKFRQNSARYDVQRLEEAHDAGERARITIRPDAQAQQLGDLFKRFFCANGN